MNKRFFTVLLTVSLTTFPPTLQAAGADTQLCDKALVSCEKEIETLKQLRAKDSEIASILQDQRDKAIRNQGASFTERLEYGAVGAAIFVGACALLGCFRK